MKYYSVKDMITYWRVDFEDILEEFLMMFDEKILRRCACCRRKNGTGHKMDCYREYTKSVNRRG